MELIHFTFNQQYSLGPIVVALGQFDGLHLAHRTIIEKVIHEAKKMNAKSGVITFYPHPDFVLGKRKDKGYLTPLKDQKQLLEQMGLDYMIVMPFDESFSHLLPKEFETRVLKAFTIVKLVAGFDYRYGYRGQGDVQTLKEQFKVHVVEEILFENQKMGSTMVRDFLGQGQLERAKEVLGRYYNISGYVAHGSKFGRKLGIRTANVEMSDEYLHLKLGVYGVLVDIKGVRYAGVCNVGHNPSFNYVDQPRVEVHILDWNQELYNEWISIDFVFYIREEIHFDDVEALKRRIQEDIDYSKPKLQRVLEDN